MLSGTPSRVALRRRVVAVGLLVALAIALVALLSEDGTSSDPAEIAESAAASAVSEEGPLAYDADRQDEFELRAALGYSHVLYEKSPAGVIASAERTARFRTEIESAAEEHDADPDLMEAMVFLESAGRDQVIAGDDPQGAAGLAQILASTATDLLEMEVDLERSRKLTRRIASSRDADRLLRRRAEIDERFDPVAALDGMGRYLEIARETFGRSDLAIASYHMGIGNLTEVVRRFAGSEDGELDELVSAGGLSYATLFFDSSPTEHERAWELLASFGDDSSTYYWRVLAAREIMRLWRDDRDRLEILAERHAAAATAEQVFHPSAQTPVFDGATEIAEAIAAGDLVRIPDGDLGFETGAAVGPVRPEALAVLAYTGARVSAISGESEPLAVRSALPPTGYSFQIRRDYASDRQAEAFQFVLDRLRALALADYAVGHNNVHVAVSGLAAALLPG